MTTKKNLTPLGIPLKKVKDLPKSIMTHMPFVMFRPHVHEHDGKNYIIMDYLYFYKNLEVTSPYQDGEYFDEMPPDNLLAFKANAFDKSIKKMVFKGTYYFNVDLNADDLRFQMEASPQTINAYNEANPNNPIAGGNFVDPDTGLPMFFHEECVIVIPPPPPGVG